MQLSGNTILITGGTSGIGRELAMRFIHAGNKVIVLGRNRIKLEELASHGCIPIQCDLENRTQIDLSIEFIQSKYPSLNVLVNNAGIQYNPYFTKERVAYEQIHREIQVNLTSQVYLTNQLLPVLKNQVKSWIINTTSALGVFPKNDGVVYSLTKAAMRNFTTALSYDLENSSVEVLEMMPPVTDTGMTAGRKTGKMDPGDFVEHVLRQVKKNRKLITVFKLRSFIWISFMFPGLANRILSK